MLTIKEELFLNQIKEIYYNNGLKDVINYLFNSEVVDNFNIAWDVLEFLSVLDDFNIQDEEIKILVLNIISKKNNIDNLNKYDNLQGVALNILENWKKEKVEYIENLILLIEQSKNLEENDEKRK